LAAVSKIAIFGACMMMELPVCIEAELFVQIRRA
jgi:hypothetical protein